MLEINGTIIIFALSFLVFIFLLDKALWQPIGKLKEARSSEIALEIQNAIQVEEKTKVIIAQVNSEINSIKKLEHQAIDQLFKESKLQAEEAEGKLKEELEAQKRKAYEELISENTLAESFIENKSRELAQLILQKIAPELNKSQESVVV
jgi:F-type H+-transporting ATPase subunit b